jgi:hypothetical protein
LTARPEESFEVCRIVGEKVYRRLRCQKCKRACTNVRRSGLRRWLDDYKKTLCCVRCRFTDYRALEFHHEGTREKDFNISDMIRSGFARETILREIAKCVVLCSNCHQIEHYDENK